MLKRLNEARYPTKIGPIKAGNWKAAFVQGFENIWLDAYRINPVPKKKTKKALPLRKRKT